MARGRFFDLGSTGQDHLEYWIGRGVNYRGVWDAFNKGRGYEDKYRTMRCHLIRIEFANYPRDLPLFNHEAVLKTLKGYFHDMKQSCLSSSDYNDAGPLFLYDVQRHSGVWDFLSELKQLLLFGTVLSDQKMMGQQLDNLQAKLKILRENFGDAVNPRLFENFMKAQTPDELHDALMALYNQRIVSVSISKEPFQGNLEATEKTLIDLRTLLPKP